MTLEEKEPAREEFKNKRKELRLEEHTIYEKYYLNTNTL